jgi:hypothetical protein
MTSYVLMMVLVLNGDTAVHHTRFKTWGSCEEARIVMKEKLGGSIKFAQCLRY